MGSFTMTSVTLSQSPLSSVAIPERPPRKALFRTLVFSIYFTSCIVLCHVIQILLQPFRLLPQTKFIARRVNEWAKGSFGKCLVSMIWLFSPSKLVLYFRDEHGNILDPAPYVEFDRQGYLARLNLPKRSIWISNHQVYTDWLYLWIICYYCEFHGNLYIILKDSLKWVPFVGPAMQWFDFIFLARSWAKDQRTLAHHLSKLANVSKKVASPLALFIFPEGTLVSPLTRPQSKKYANKVGLDDCRHLLLPRSTGLLYCARALKQEIDDLVLVDATIGYPGIPSDGYGQSYYTLRSIFMQGVPPPSVHVSITIRNIKAGPPPLNLEHAAKDAGNMPVGDIGSFDREICHLDLNAGELEKRAFDAWLLARWREKDDLMDGFYRNGDFVSGAFVRNKADAGEYYRPDETPSPIGSDTSKGIRMDKQKQYVAVPIRPRRPFIEMMNNIAYGVPLFGGWAVWRTWHAWHA